jgi:hypothetical protein
VPNDSKRKKKRVEVVGLLGVGLDTDDGHQRLTRGENFVLIGGSKGTHERMQDTAVRVNERLKKRGKRLEDASPDEIVDLVRDERE